MAKFKSREIALISLPIIVLGAFGWWANSRQKERVEHESGPYRTRLVSIEDVPLTPFERWQGFDSKVRIMATDDGKPDLPASVKLKGRRSLEGELFLSGKAGREKLPVSANGLGHDGVSSRQSGALLRIHNFAASREEAEGLETTLLANTRAIKGGSARLQGELFVQNGTYKNLKLAELSPSFQLWRGRKDVLTFLARPIQINHELHPLKTVVDRSAPKLLSAQVAHLSPRETALDRAGDNGDTFVIVTFDCSSLNSLTRNHRFGNAVLEDEFGKEIEELNISGTSTAPDGKTSLHDRVKTFSIPADRGRITFKTWFSYYGSWPTPISVEVRKRPQSSAPSKLKLQSVRLVNASGVDSVEARVSYTGAQRLTREQDAQRQHVSTLFQDVMAPRDAGTDRLLSNYSQHLEYAGGKTQWSGRYVGDARPKCEPDNSCIITYPLPAMSSWQLGQSARFKAQIGIEDDGFLAIDLPISKAK